MKLLTVIKQAWIIGMVIHLTSFYGCNEKMTKEQEIEARICAMALHDTMSKHLPSDHKELLSIHPALSKDMEVVFDEKFSSLDGETVFYPPKVEHGTMSIPGDSRHWNVSCHKCLDHKEKDCYELEVELYDPCLGVHKGSFHYRYHYQEVDGEWVCVSS